MPADNPATSENGPAAAHRGLTRWQAVPLAIGSIAGSGILFLPSATYAKAGDNSLLVWGLSILLCLPMLLMFDDMVRANPDGRGIEAFIRMGLGPLFGRAVPVLFIALVIVGLPSGAFVAGRYVSRTFHGGLAATSAVAAAVLLAALATNLAGVRTSSRLQTVVTWGLVAMATILLGSALPSAGGHLDTVTPDSGHLSVVLPGMLLAFWAFAGFENLTFLSREFRRPAKDFLPVSAIALSVYGVFTILLTVAIAVRIPRGDVDEVTGLLQLAATMHPEKLVTWAVTVIAFSAMLLNAVAWVWGVSGLVSDAAHNGMLPSRFAAPDGARGVSRGTAALLVALFAVTFTVLVLFPGLVVDATATASAIFMILYVLAIVSYARVRGLTVRSALNMVLLVVMAVSLVQARWQSLYGVVVLLLALGVQFGQRRFGARAGAAGGPAGEAPQPVPSAAERESST
ncbi:APC family permease [Actinacidiphila epipremni]|uniref:Amino acid permease n=1 Tax=Actinacidiphila epipremni TaxID=2053013 RepID=A0ABX0ZMP7_9ACTN|nr:amino acid permease [Actinacidiphila epipremni]NJP42901.1 amino acid permease [Actinacidiphila epipremni]